MGGTGIGERLLQCAQEAVHVPTSFGLMQARVLRWGAAEALLVARHGGGHRVPPHSVNYRAMAEGLVRLGVRHCLASAAVGSLRPEWGPGTLVVCSDFLELSGRAVSRFERSVAHTDFSRPFDPKGRAALLESAAAAGEEVQDGGVYVCANGPRYETPAEIAQYRRIGGDLVGMTAGSEAVAMREAGIGYACLAVVTNAASGVAGAPLSHDEVVQEMERSGERAVTVLKGAVERLSGSD